MMSGDRTLWIAIEDTTASNGPPALLTVTQVAEQLETSDKTVTRAIEHGHLEAVDISERSTGLKHRANYRVRPEWVDEYIETRRVPPVVPKRSRRSSRNGAPVEFIK